MITKIQAMAVVTALCTEATEVLNGDMSPETKNAVGMLLVSLGRVINALDNEGFFDE